MKLLWQCTYDDCQAPRVGDAKYCHTHLKGFEKMARDVKKAASKVKKPIKKVADKRSKELREYAKLRRQYLDTHPCCEVRECHNKSKDIHHMRTRTNENLLNSNLFLAVCTPCHYRITVDSAWAIREGYSLPRNQKI